MINRRPRFRLFVVAVLVAASLCIAVVTAVLLWPEWRARQQTCSFLEQFDPEHETTEATQAAIRRIGAAAIPTLVDAIHSPDESMRLRGVWGLACLGPQAAPAMPELMGLLLDRSPDVRAPLDWALDEITPRLRPTAIPSLVEKLHDEDDRVRGRVVVEIGRFDADAARAVPALVGVLRQDRNASVRAYAAWAVARIGPRAHEALPALLEAINDEDPTVRGWAARALGEIRPPIDLALPELVRLLKDPSAAARCGAAYGLQRFGPAAEPATAGLMAALEDPDVFVQSEAAMALAQIGPAARDAVPSLLRKLQHREKVVRIYAAIALGRCGADAPGVVPALLSALQDPNRQMHRCVWGALERCASAANEELVEADHVWLLLRAARSESRAMERSMAFAVLSKMGPVAVPTLVTAAQDPDAVMRLIALRALGEMGTAAVQSIPAVTAALSDADGQAREAAVEALAKIAPQRETTVTRLLESLKDSSVQQRAAESLASMGPPVVPELVMLLKDENANRRMGAAWALGMMGADGKPAVPALIEAAAQREDRVLAWWSMKSLGQIGPDAAEAVPTLVNRLKDPNSTIAQQATSVLSKLGSAATPTLVGLLEGDDANTRESVAEVLFYFGSKAEPAVAGLIQLLSDERASTRRAAARSLGAIGPQAKASVPQLVQLLEDTDRETRSLTVVALGRIGPEAKDAVAALLELVPHSDESLRNQVIWAITEIGPNAAPQLAETLRTCADSKVRQAAAEALGEIGAQTPDVAAALIAALADSSEDVRNECVCAIARMGPSAIVPLQAATISENELLRAGAAHALELIERGPKPQ